VKIDIYFVDVIFQCRFPTLIGTKVAQYLLIPSLENKHLMLNLIMKRIWDLNITSIFFF